jgi:TolA-binding protein
VRLGDYDKAIQSFEKAAKSENDVIAPMSLKKAGIVYLELKDNASALKAFEAIKNDYPTSDEAKDIEKFISLAQ